jgi:hypothetical protein
MREICAMGLTFPVYPPADLDKLNQQKKKELAAAIRQVLEKDPEVQQLLRVPEVRKLLIEKTWDTYQALLRRP